jgi:nucleoside-diphosphate-sugar epimerase
MHIAILGSTSHVAKATMEFLRRQASLTHVARDQQRVRNHLEQFGYANDSEQHRILTFAEFATSNIVCDAIINCVGFGTPEKVAAAGLDLYRLTDRMDELCLSYLERNPRTVFVNLSSGAVYGTAHEALIGPAAVFIMELNQPRESDHYRLAKLHCERKHRAWQSASIIDLRLFSFFSRHIDLSSRYLICEIVRSIREHRPLVTGANDIVRDFVHPEDLADLMLRSARGIGINVAVDVFSRAALKKSELLAVAATRFGLEIVVEQQDVSASPTGTKSFYASGNNVATQVVGYSPRWTSIDAVIEQMALVI